MATIVCRCGKTFEAASYNFKTCPECKANYKKANNLKFREQNPNYNKRNTVQKKSPDAAPFKHVKFR